MLRGWRMTDFAQAEKARVKAQVDAEIAAARAVRLALPEPKRLPSRATEQDGVVLACGSDLTPKPVAWLWRHWLALGKLHILAGAPGHGKTTIAIAVAATITIGGRFPDGSHCAPGNVLIWSGEDDPSDTLLPRLIAAGADKARVFFVTGSRVAGEVTPFDPARDLVDLTAAAERLGGVSLLVVDPVVHAVAADTHKNGEVRRALQPLVDLAACLNAAVLGISHFSKAGQGQDPTQRVVGSVAFAAVARVVWVAAKVKGEEGQDRRILARSKSNLGADSGGFEYQLEQVEALPGIEASRVTWGKAVAGTARELLTDPAEQGDDASDASELLRAELSADAWKNGDAASKPLKDAGFTKKQIWSASKKLAVIRRKDGMQGGWLWRLPGVSNTPYAMDKPEDSSEGSEGSNIQNRESWNLRAESSALADAGAEEIL